MKLKYLLLSAALLAAPVARAQDEAPKADATERKATSPGREVADASVVAGIPLSNAERVVDANAADRLSWQLRNLARQAQLPLGKAEVLCWTGAEYKRAEVPALTGKVKDELARLGYIYNTMGGPLEAPGSLTQPFTASSEDQHKYLLGYWVEADNMLLLVWAPIEAQPKPEEKPKPDADA